MASKHEDFDKQFQEDLERAQALSLESLALEQFKNKKRIEELNFKSKHDSKSTKTTSVSRTSSMSETDRLERHQVKSRPRPGTAGGGQSNPIIAPPPSSRRLSSGYNASDSSTPDLISFTSPPTTNTVDEFCKPIESTKNQISTQIMPSPNVLRSESIMQQYQLQQYQPPAPNNLISMLLSTPSSIPPRPQWQYNQYPYSNRNVVDGRMAQNMATPNLSRIGFNIPSTPPTTAPVLPPFNIPAHESSANIPSTPKAPILPPKNITPGPSLSLSSSSSKSSNVIAIKGPTTTKSLKSEKQSPNLIDLAPSGVDDGNSVRVSILEAFDPLLNPGANGSSISVTDAISIDCFDDSSSVSGSVYDEYDPYDFIYSGSGNNSLSDPMYAAVVKLENAPLSPPPPLPPRTHQSTMERRKNSLDAWAKKKTRLYDNIMCIDQKTAPNDSDLAAFYKMVQNIRCGFNYNDPDTNMGLIISPMMQHKYKEETSIKLCVYPQYEGSDFDKPVSFTCNVTCSVEHVTLHVTCELEAPSKDQYTLKVWGYNEYLAPTTLLSDYEYIHNCIKLEEDVLLILVPDRLVDRSFARSPQDDNRDREIKLIDLIPNEPLSPITYEHLSILLETLEKEMGKLEQAADQIEKNASPDIMPQLQPSGVIQSIKLVVKLMGTLETFEITEAVDSLKTTCQKFLQQPDEVPRNSWGGESISELINSNCEKIRIAIQGLIEMYSQAFRVNFQLKNPVDALSNTLSLMEVTDTLLIRVCGIHRPSPDWRHDNFMVAAQVYHGTRPIGIPMLSQPTALTQNLYPRILFNCWLNMQDIFISALAREARLVFVIYGRTLEQPESGDNSNTPQFLQEELGWASVQFFNFDRIMTQGSVLLSIWPKESNHIYGPAPSPGIHPSPDHPVLGIEIAVPAKIVFPPSDELVSSGYNIGEFNSLDSQTQQQLIEICEQDMLFRVPSDVREVLWEKRHYLYDIPAALPKVLLAAHSWDWSCLPDLHGMLKHWQPLQPVQAIQLLLPTFPDMEVRKLAITWIRYINSDELVDYLPQLVVALRHELYETSPLAKFLLERSLKSPRVAHHLFWLLSHNLPGTMPQNFTCETIEKDVSNVSEARYNRKMMLLLRALLAICGESLRKCFLSQQLLVKELNEIAENVQKTKEAHRLHVLCNALEAVNQSLKENPTSLPLSPTLRVCGVRIGSCSYFPSNTLPLKISFLAHDGSTIPAIYKVGDDLQQDQLVLQIVRIMDKMWLREGLDLKMVTFSCVPTGKKRGMIELVSKAETLRKIQTEHGLTGSFKDKPIAEWLAKHNPSELEYSRAVENFTASCAGYCVVTYVLGVCDRHNDNIMLKNSGHLFHIDFGKFLGDAQMFGNFKRDRTPFVLTSDMAYVINGGDRPSEKFHQFVDLCCQAFNIVRNNGNLFLHLFTLMASSGICGVTTEAVSNLHKALLPGQSNPEAAAYFARLIESSLKSWFTQVNFFLHNLAQLKFTGDHGDNQLLSFVPKTYSMATDGRLIHVSVIGYRKRYDPDKYYVYILRVERENQGQYMDVLRTYKEFYEFYQKLCLHFPLAKLHSLSSGLQMGRSNIKQVASKRFYDISLFVKSLFATADEICHSDLVYTFFHPLLRDQQLADQFDKKAKDRRIEERSEMGRLKGQLKLSIQFHRGVFTVMVHHARSLPLVGNAQEPSTYVKVYLQPDPSKTTKRKTKIVKRNCHPSFMEMLEYRMALDIVRRRILKATVWNHDPLQENEFLGGVELDLSQFDLTQEMTEWYPLTNLSR